MAAVHHLGLIYFVMLDYQRSLPAARKPTLKFRVDRICGFEDIVIRRFSKFGFWRFRPLNIIGHDRDAKRYFLVRNRFI